MEGARRSFPLLRPCLLRLFISRGLPIKPPSWAPPRGARGRISAEIERQEREGRRLGLPAEAFSSPPAASLLLLGKPILLLYGDLCAGAQCCCPRAAAAAAGAGAAAAAAASAGLPAVGAAQVREAGVPLPHLPRHVPAAVAADGARRRAALHRLPARPRRPVGAAPLQPPLRGGLLHAARLPLHRLLPHPPAPRVPARLRLLQAGAGAQVHARDLHALLRAHRLLHRREPRLPAQDPGALRPRRGHLPAPRRAPGSPQPLHGRGPQGGPHRHVRRHRPAAGEDRRPPQGHWRPRGQLQPLQPDAVAVSHGGEPLQAQGQHRQLQPRRDGLQRRAAVHRPRQGPPAGASQLVRAGDQHGEHHPQLVLREQPLHAGVQLPVPDGRRRHPALQPALRPAAVQVRAGAHGAHAQGRRRQVLRLRDAGGGRGGQDRRVAVKGPDGGGRRRAQDQHHHAGAAGAPAVGAAALHGHAGGQEAAQDEDQAVHPGLQAGVRALLHPRRRARRAGRAGEEPGAHRLAHGAVEDDAVQVRQHVEQLALVRAGLLGGQGEDPEARQDLADRVRVGVQVQQRRVEGAPDREPGQGEEPLDGGDRQLPGGCSKDLKGWQRMNNQER